MTYLNIRQRPRSWQSCDKCDSYSGEWMNPLHTLTREALARLENPCDNCWHSIEESRLQLDTFLSGREFTGTNPAQSKVMGRRYRKDIIRSEVSDTKEFQLAPEDRGYIKDPEQRAASEARCGALYKAQKTRVNELYKEWKSIDAAVLRKAKAEIKVLVKQFMRDRDVKHLEEANKLASVACGFPKEHLKKRNEALEYPQRLDCYWE